MAPLFGLAYALVSGVEYVYNALLSYDASIKYKLAHTSQVWSIEDVLNDTYDPIQRRIYIKNAGGNKVSFLQRRSDEDPIMVDSRATSVNPLLIHTRSAYDGGNFDFVVVIPYKYASSDIYGMKALVKYYKLAGKRFDITE